MGLPKLYTIRRRSVVGVSLYLPSLLLQSKVKLPFIALGRFGKFESFKLSKSKPNTKNKLSKLRRSFNGKLKRKRRGA